MSSHERGRSPAAGQANHLRQAASASPHLPLDASYHRPENSHYEGSLGAQDTPGAFGDASFTQTSQQSPNFFLGPTYTEFQAQQRDVQQPTAVSSSDLNGNNLATRAFLQSQGSDQSVSTSGYNYSAGGPGSNNLSSVALSQGNSPGINNELTTFPSFDFTRDDFDQNTALDPSLLTGDIAGDIDPSTLDLLPQENDSENANASFDSMASAIQSQSPTPPHLLPDMSHQQATASSPSGSPGFQQNNFQSLSRPRNTSESLDPSSAMFPQGQNEWSNLGAYRTHRRTPSDNYSDYSSHSNQASPFMQTMDSFDNGHSSPLLNPSQDPAFSDALGMHHFSLNDTQQQYNHSPGHSPHVSPQLTPQQQALPPFTVENNYGLNVDMNGQFMQQQNNGLEMFPSAGQEAFPSINQQSPGDLGHADQMSPPEINIDYAPPSKNPVELSRPTNQDGEALSPPMRTQSRNRMRAKSDPYAGSRSQTPSLPGRGRSPSLQPQLSGGDNLAPFDNRSTSSRSSSPARGRNGSLGRHRSSSNASDHRDYILELANPERAPSNGSENKRHQKHPATFQCGLCPKRFTRAYNLRSHLRTHTDERPFVCTVCGKAFARQHDRRRHEGLHSGEKKFVCRGALQSGSQWGCGRRFARADALGRHFRSEAGRICIKPLLDEEEAERQKVRREQEQQAQAVAGFVSPQPIMSGPGQFDQMGNFFPAALLQQYPALAGIDWNAIPQGPPPEEDYSGRSSFEASSGGEYYDELSENEMGSYADSDQISGMNTMGMQQGVGMQAQSDAQGYGVYGNQGTDYISDFESR